MNKNDELIHIKQRLIIEGRVSDKLSDNSDSDFLAFLLSATPKPFQVRLYRLLQPLGLLELLI